MDKYKFLFKQQVIEFYLQNSKNRSLIHLNLNLTWYKRLKIGNFLQNCLFILWHCQFKCD